MGNKNTVLVANCLVREVIFGEVGIAPLGFVHHLGQICGVCKNGTPTRRHQDDPRHAM